MATIKSFTSLEQSRKLVEILPLESADMCYLPIHIGDEHHFIASLSPYSVCTKMTDVSIEYCTPCWSLAALSEFILPYIVGDDGNNYKFYLSKDGLDRWIAYYKSGDVSIHICEESDNMIDVILEMVCWLKKEEYI